jgi:hypothetical protein
MCMSLRERLCRSFGQRLEFSIGAPREFFNDHAGQNALALAFLQASGGLFVTPTFSRRLRLIDFPIEKIIIARPRVDLAPANLTSEISRLLVCMLISCRGVRHPAIGTAKIFGRPNVACHPAIMRRTEHVFQPRRLPQSMTSYSNPEIRRLSDSVFLTPQILRAPRR